MNATNYNLPLTSNAFFALHKIDQGLVGTSDYLGLCYYWASEYKYHLREATPKQRKLVHDRILAAGLRLDGVSKKHEEIVKKVCEKRLRKVYGLT